MATTDKRRSQAWATWVVAVCAIGVWIEAVVLIGRNLHVW